MLVRSCSVLTLSDPVEMSTGARMPLFYMQRGHVAAGFLLMSVCMSLHLQHTELRLDNTADSCLLEGLSLFFSVLPAVVQGEEGDEDEEEERTWTNYGNDGASFSDLRTRPGKSTTPDATPPLWNLEFHIILKNTAVLYCMGCNFDYTTILYIVWDVIYEYTTICILWDGMISSP